MLYGDFNRVVFLEEILNFISGFGATKAELSTIRTAVQKRTKQLVSARCEYSASAGGLAHMGLKPTKLRLQNAKSKAPAGGQRYDSRILQTTCSMATLY